MIRRLLLLSCCLLSSSVASAGDYVAYVPFYNGSSFRDVLQYSGTSNYDALVNFESQDDAVNYCLSYTPIQLIRLDGAINYMSNWQTNSNLGAASPAGLFSSFSSKFYVSNVVSGVVVTDAYTFRSRHTAAAQLLSDLINAGFRPPFRAVFPQNIYSSVSPKSTPNSFVTLSVAPFIVYGLFGTNDTYRAMIVSRLSDISSSLHSITNFQSLISGSLDTLSPSVASLAHETMNLRSSFDAYARQVYVLDSLPFSSYPSSDDMALGVQALYNLTPTAGGANTPEEQYTQLKSMYQLPWTDLTDATSHGSQFMQIVKGKVAAERKRVDAIASVADSYNHVKNPVTGQEQTLVEALETWGNDLAQAALFNYQYETPTTNNPYKALVGGDELRKQLRADVEAMRRWIHQGLVEGALPVTNPSNGAPLSVTVTGGIAADLNVDQVEALLGNTYNVRLDGMDTIDSWFGFWRNYTGMINSGSPGYLKTYLDRFNDFSGYTENHNYLLDAKNALYNNYDSISEITYNGLNTANTTLSYIANSVASDGPIVSGLTAIEDAIKNLNLTNSVASSSNILVNVTNEYALSKVAPTSNLGPLHIDLTIDRDHAVAFKASQVTMTGDFYVDSIRLLQGQIEQSRSSAVTLGVLQTNLQAIANQFVDFDQADAESTVNREISEVEQQYSDHENDVNTLTQHIVSDFNASMDTYLQEARTILSKFEAIPSSVLKPQYIQVNLPSFGGKSLGSFSINLSSSGVAETIESVRTCFSFLWWCLAGLLSWFLYRLFFRMVDAVIHRCLALGGLQVGYSWVRNHGGS